MSSGHMSNTAVGSRDSSWQRWKWDLGAASWSPRRCFLSSFYVFIRVLNWATCRWDQDFLSRWPNCGVLIRLNDISHKIPQPLDIQSRLMRCCCCLSHPVRHDASWSQVCQLCLGTVGNGSAVDDYCSTVAGRIEGRCCVKNSNSSDHERLIVGYESPSKHWHEHLLNMLWRVLSRVDVEEKDAADSPKLKNTSLQFFFYYSFGREKFKKNLFFCFTVCLFYADKLFATLHTSFIVHIYITLFQLSLFCFQGWIFPTVHLLTWETCRKPQLQ